MREASLLSTHEIGALVALVNQDRLSEAEHGARTLLTMHPDAGMLWKILSVALVRQGKDALQALRKAAELMPQDAEAHRNLGSALHDQGQFEPALASLRRALAIEPHDADALVDAADAMRALGRAREAVPLYQRALQWNPGMAEAQNNLGNAFLELGQHDDAVGCYRLALEIKPDDAQIHCNLANALATLGRREEAVASYRQALTLKPGDVEALNNLGNVLRDLGQRREAALHYARAIELDPRRADSHGNLGNVLFELRRLEEAVESFNSALALQPDYAMAHLSLGSALRMKRRAADAERSCQAALALDPNYVDALCLLGELRADRGRFSEAEELFQRAIAINPDFPFAFFSIAAHRKMTTNDTAWLQGAEALRAKRLPLGHEISLHYALGKYFDDVRQYDDAFSHYRQANELAKRYGSSFDNVKLTQRVDQIIGRFDPAFIRQCQERGSASELPVFIIGMPRSGTSLAEQILASHPAVFGAGELTYWDPAFLAFKKAGGLESGLAGTNLIPSTASNYLSRLSAISGGALRVVDKMPANFMYAGFIHAVFPRARIIHMQRHPIDTCLSIYFQNFFNMGPYANDLDNLASYYGEYLRITAYWRAVLPATTLLEIPYEALIGDQEGWTRRMVDFIGLPWNSKCLDFHQTERDVITASKWQVRQKIHTASAGRWRNYEKYIAPLQHLMDVPTYQ